MIPASIGVAVLAYLLGSIPFGLLLTRAAGLGDIRRIGSGSIGATNVLRTGRRGLAAATLLLDGGKGAVATLLAAYWFGPASLPVFLAGAFAVIGHCQPIWLGFRGGKGVATGAGVLIAADWRVAIGAGAVWLATALLTRISSAGAIAACLAAIPLAALISNRVILGLAFVLGSYIVSRHRANIGRLLAGTEPRIGQKA